MTPLNLRNRIFYALKPLIPRQVQIQLRRKIARHLRQKYRHTWPIDPNSATPPPGWPGWPDNKKFALVLSHDVDTLQGYQNVLKLTDLEESLGFRSLFNFVPERYGEISLDLIKELKSRGFDVGVHGLKHDGKLFLSKEIFNNRVPKIKAYMEKWETKGFTAPSMLCNLDWLKSLNLDYSISSFDTDPFEPEPDGKGTIFPFVVNHRNTSGNLSFVELPYTLPQDSTLFLILKEKTIDIWKQKVDWIAQKGGMVLVNTHPDYMNFENGNFTKMDYPVSRYKEFLEYIKRQYKNQYYHALPRDIATTINTKKRSHQLQKPDLPIPCFIHKDVQSENRPLRVAMLTYSFYESDGRVRRYAETLAQRGDVVDVISLCNEKQGSFDRLKGVNVYRVQKRVRDEKGKFDYFFRIMKFFFRSAAMVTSNHLKRPYDIVHVHSVPDFEVFAAFVPKLLGAGVILDIHDIVPELYANKFHVGRDSLTFRLLRMIEKLSTAFADHVIIANDLWRQTLIGRSVCNGKCTSIMNYPDGSLFFKKSIVKENEKFVFLYPGTLNFHQGLDIAIKAFDQVRDCIPYAEFHIYGEGPARKQLENLTRQFNLQGRVLLKDSVPLDEIAKIMANADIGVIPKRNDSFGGEAFSTKTLEFMSLGVPIIVARTKIDQYHFNDEVVRFFEPENVEDLAEAMIAMAKDKSLKEKQSTCALKFVNQYNWQVKKHLYLDLVNKL